MTTVEILLTFSYWHFFFELLTFFNGPGHSFEFVQYIEFSFDHISILCRGSRGRKIWYVVHWLVGIAASLVGVINVFTGLQAYHERTLEDVRIWTAIFIVELCLVLLVYLLQEKWHYLGQHGTASKSQTAHHKLSEEESCVWSKLVSLLSTNIVYVWRVRNVMKFNKSLRNGKGYDSFYW